MNCIKCKWFGTCPKCKGFEKKSEYQQLDNMTPKEKEIEEIWLQVRRMLEDE